VPHHGRSDAMVAILDMTFPFPVPRRMEQVAKSDEEPVLDHEMVAAVPEFQTVVLIGDAGLIGFVFAAAALTTKNAKVINLESIVFDLSWL